MHESGSPSTDSVIKVLIADTTRMASQLLADAVKQDPGLAVVSVCSTVNDAVQAANAQSPDVVVVSLNMDDQPMKGLDVCRQVRTSPLGSAVVILLDNSKRDLVIAAFAAGARGVFCRADSVDSLRKCIHRVHTGQIWANSTEMRFVLDAFASATPTRLVDANGKILLSKREQDVVRCVTEGLTNREIAAQLNLSEHTVKNYIFRIFDKLGVSTRVEMVLYAFSQRTRPQDIAASQLPGLPGDQVSEFELTRRAAEAGDCSSQLRLAEMYATGSGVAKDEAAAYAWYLVAQKMGERTSSTAHAASSKLARALSYEEREEAKRRASEMSSVASERAGAQSEHGPASLPMAIGSTPLVLVPPPPK